MEEKLVSICKLLEFYFSDSNLSKDTFLWTKMEESSEGWIAFDVLLTFNKLLR